ncbi:polymorphic toxin-type HINT domain-containing protein, partial [Streptomyces sp. NPDC002520]
DTQPTPRSDEQNDHADPSKPTPPVCSFSNGVLKEGEYVLASDPETSILQARQVTDTITGDGLKHLVTLTVDPDGKNGKAKPSTITATANHPFWLPDYGTWAEAGDLEPGMWLQTAAGTWVQITAIDDTHRTQKVHNLTVEGQHTYYVLVGDSPVLVHNAGCPTRLKVPSGDNMAAYKYQRRVTGQETEQVWRLNSGHHAGRRVEVDGGPSNGYITEAKWTGRNSAAWESSPYHPSKFFNEDKVVDQAQRLLDLDAGLGGKGVRYAVSNVEGAAFFRGVLREHFPDEMASGRLAVWHVPGDGM